MVLEGLGLRGTRRPGHSNTGSPSFDVSSRTRCLGKQLDCEVCWPRCESKYSSPHGFEILRAKAVFRRIQSVKVMIYTALYRSSKIEYEVGMKSRKPTMMIEVRCDKGSRRDASLCSITILGQIKREGCRASTCANEETQRNMNGVSLEEEGTVRMEQGKEAFREFGSFGWLNCATEAGFCFISRRSSWL